MAETCEEWCGHVQNEHRKGEARIQPLADDVYASDRALRPTVVVPAAICHDAVVVWDRRMLGGEEYTATAFGVQLEFAQWMGELPRLRVAVLTFNVQCPSGFTMEELEALAIAIVLDGFQLVACFGDCEFSVGVAANEVMLNIARCGVLPIVMQEEITKLCFARCILLMRPRLRAASPRLRAASLRQLRPPLRELPMRALRPTC